MSEFKTIPGFEKYEISENGVIRNKKTGYILKHFDTRKGYKRLSLQNDFNEEKPMTVHRLIAITFIPNPENKATVNHKNGIKHDNRKINLEWMTNRENLKHAYAEGIRSSSGESHPQSKLTNEDVIQIRYLATKGVRNKHLMNLYNISGPTISNIVARRVWKHI